MEEMKKEMKESATAQAKPTYEQLETAAYELTEECKRLYTEYQKLSIANAFKRLDYLFKVLKYSDAFSKEFVQNCTKEIVSMMTVENNPTIEE